MTENLPAVHYGTQELIAEERAFPAIRRERTDGWIAVLEPVTMLAEAVAGTDFVPRAIQNNAPAVAAAILFGRELDMPPMQALAQIHMIEGRPSVSAEHLRAMVLAAGHEFSFTTLSGGEVTVSGRRKGSTLPPTVVTWTLAMAQAAQLTGKKNWIRHPRQMLEARATAELCRLIFADVIHGLGALEELEDDGDGEGATPDSKARVSRAKKGADSVRAAGASSEADAPPSPAAPSAPAASRAPRPPLPGAKAKAAPAGSTPGEGQSSSSPTAGAAPVAKPPQCPHISNGEQCTWDAGHEEDWHSWHLANKAAPVGEGDGSAEDIAATGSDIAYDHAPDDGSNGPTPEAEIPDAEVVEDRDRHCSDYATTHGRHAWTDDDGAWGCPGNQLVDGGPVADKPEDLHPGQRRALFAAFKSLGVKDDDERHHATSALLGRKVTSWTELDERDGSRMLTAMANVNTRDELEELIRKAAEQWGADGGA